MSTEGRAPPSKARRQAAGARAERRESSQLVSESQSRQRDRAKAQAYVAVAFSMRQRSAAKAQRQNGVERTVADHLVATMASATVFRLRAVVGRVEEEGEEEEAVVTFLVAVAQIKAWRKAKSRKARADN